MKWHNLVMTAVRQIAKNSPDGATSFDIREHLGERGPHDRCVIAHTLTRLYRDGKLTRSPIAKNGAKTFIYKPIMKMTDAVMEIITEHPGITSGEIVPHLPDALRPKTHHIGGTLQRLSLAGRIEKSPVVKGSKAVTGYWAADSRVNQISDASQATESEPVSLPRRDPNQEYPNWICPYLHDFQLHEIIRLAHLADTDGSYENVANLVAVCSPKVIASMAIWNIRFRRSVDDKNALLDGARKEFNALMDLIGKKADEISTFFPVF